MYSLCGVETPVTEGWDCGSKTLKLSVLDPPPGDGFVTTSGKAPTFAISDAVRVIVSCPASKGVVTACGEPANVTEELDRKFLPRIERTGGLAVTDAAAGVMLVICGCGFKANPEVTTKLAVEVPPPGAGLRTSTENDPACARSDDTRVIVIVPLFT